MKVSKKDYQLKYNILCVTQFAKPIAVLYPLSCDVGDEVQLMPSFPFCITLPQLAKKHIHFFRLQTS